MISFKNVSIKYGEYDILNDFNLEIKKGEVLTLFGPSGCGKTTLMKSILGITGPSKGSVLVNGMVAKNYTKIISYTPQDNQLLPWLTVEQNIKLWLKESNADKVSISDILEEVDLSNHKSKLIKELSGGMQRRTALARGMATKALIMCFDEVMVSIERGMRRKLMMYLRKYLKDNDITALLISHDHEEAVFLSDRIVVLSPAPTKILKEIDVNSYVGRDRNEELFDKDVFLSTCTKIVA